MRLSKAKIRGLALSSLFFLVACSSTPEQEIDVHQITAENHAELQEAEVTQTETEYTSEPKGIDGNVLLDNAPVKQILNSLESVADTLNVLSFGIFAAERT